MRIFLTVGTQLPFDRLVRSIDSWVVDKKNISVFGQIGDAAYCPSNFNYEPFLTPDQFNSQFEEADLVLSHAGMGTIITSLTKKKNIILLPRLAKHGEHRNDHQLATVRHFREKGLQIAFDEKELIDLLEKNSNVDLPPISIFADTTLTDGIFEFINR